MSKTISVFPDIQPGAVFKPRSGRYLKRVLKRYYAPWYGGEVVKWERVGSPSPPEVWGIRQFAERIAERVRENE